MEGWWIWFRTRLWRILAWNKGWRQRFNTERNWIHRGKALSALFQKEGLHGKGKGDECRESTRLSRYHVTALSPHNNFVSLEFPLVPIVEMRKLKWSKMKMSKITHLVPCEVCSTPVHFKAYVCLSHHVDSPWMYKEKRRSKGGESTSYWGEFLWSYVEEVAFRLGLVRTYDKEEQNWIL